MNKVFLPLLLTIFILTSCNKNSSNAKVEGICYIGKFVANGCRGTSIIEVISPRVGKLKSSMFRIGENYETVIDYTIYTVLDDAFKDGQPFYFTMDSLTEIGITTAECAWPKYGAVVKEISTRSCDEVMN